MARGKGRSGRRYVRDAKGRFASKGAGATARGGRLKTASGKKRATQTMKVSGAKAAGTISKPKGLKPQSSQKLKTGVATSRLKATAKRSETTVMGSSRVPAAQRPGSMTSTLRSTLRNLAQADARRIREIEAITGQPVRAPRRAPAGQGATVRAPGRRSVSGTLRDNLRGLAQSDARTTRGMADLAKSKPAGVIKGGTSRKALPAAKAKKAASKPKTSRRAVIGKISEAKASRIVARIDANRPGRRAASGSARRTQNAIKTHRKATDFTLAAAARARRRGKTMTVAQSLQRAVSNAAKRRR